MINKETITSANLDQLEPLLEPLAEIYKIAFAGAPWFEASKCIKESCSVGFCERKPGNCCPDCNSVLAEAYDSQDLMAMWWAMIEQENALMEVETEDDTPLRATIARPTTPAELFKRKYSDNVEMRDWLKQQLPSGLVWIEDTFANRQRRPKGNLKNRGETLAAIAVAYREPTVCTRTIAPQIVAATLRDIRNTKVFVGSENSEKMISIISAGEREYAGGFTVPDRRTLLAINALKKVS